MILYYLALFVGTVASQVNLETYLIYYILYIYIYIYFFFFLYKLINAGVDVDRRQTGDSH